ncbi:MULTISPECIES: acyl carrier protein [Streptomyces]|uniref:acyl carrier protein n=1 Tax=Streptomyces TaxID=1883 RepID=UPI001FFE077F|nr:acyl carrier protein [Streptomyces sp. 4R-3d]
MNSIDAFVQLLRDEVGLDVGPEDLRIGLDQVEGWDSVHLLTLLTHLEKLTGRRISLLDALEAPHLEALYAVAVGR